MKRIIAACLLAAGAFIPGILNAQALKLDIQGITYEEDTLTSKDNIIVSNNDLDISMSPNAL